MMKKKKLNNRSADFVEGDVEVWREVEVGEWRLRMNWASANSLVNGRSEVPAFSCMQSTPRTANQPTQQPSSRKHPVDSLCEQSLSEQIRAERRHLVKCELIHSRRVTNAERSKKTESRSSLFAVAFVGSVARS
jgi:hypothetical protein